MLNEQYQVEADEGFECLEPRSMHLQEDRDNDYYTMTETQFALDML